MDDVTDYVFREIVATTAKPHVLFTEFTSTDALCSKGRARALRKLMFSANQRPIVAQLWGSTPEYFTQAAVLIEELGFDGIDINMGCPDKGVMKKNAGAALITNPVLAQKLIAAVKSAAHNLPLSIKTRLATTPDLTREWLSFLLTQDIAAVILHGRDAPSMSKHAADWEAIGKAVQLKNSLNPQSVLLGNGDVTSYQEVLAKYSQYQVDGVMVGRGIFGNPWLFDQTNPQIEHTTKEYLDLLLRHTKLFVDTWGETKNFNLLKKFFKVYVRDFRGADALRQKLMACTNYSQIVIQLGHPYNQ